ncbi:protein max isoform X2 [Diabrotica virgifera virgifera]|uniref:Protein max n=1 Tax=Diabrotica virgifera virgifera TaxID=50390 RepID=A0A6P7F0Z1_DIAVI|nr:protein max isoform X2 [Diabrotica virgifera virgifera]
MMSDDDRDIDVESDEGDDSDSRQATSRQNAGGQYYSQAEKRAHHNALERKRRDHIKDSFSSLRDSVPALNGEKASRAQILKKAAEYILFMRKKNSSHQQDIEDLKRQNNLLEAQIRTLEKAKTTGDIKDDVFIETESDTSDFEGSIQQRRPKKMKVVSYHSINKE